jgi:hypothetical protein
MSDLIEAELRIVRRKGQIGAQDQSDAEPHGTSSHLAD